LQHLVRVGSLDINHLGYCGCRFGSILIEEKKYFCVFVAEAKFGEKLVELHGIMGCGKGKTPLGNAGRAETE